MLRAPVAEYEALDPIGGSAPSEIGDVRCRDAVGY